MAKKTLLIAIFSIFLFFVLFAPLMSFAQCKGGLVPCGRSCDDPDTSLDESKPCTLCHAFVLIKRIIDFLSIIAAAFLTIMVFVGAIIFITAHGSPEWITKGRQTITAAIIGFVIVLSSWIIVNTIVIFASGNSAGEVFGRPWNKIDCGSGSSGGSTRLENEQSNGGPSESETRQVVAEKISEAEEVGNFTSYGVESITNELTQYSRSMLAGIFNFGPSVHRAINYYNNINNIDLVRYPTNLGVQNARFGSRFNLNFHFDPQSRKTWTSTMGSQMDHKTSFIVATRLDDGSVYRFPPSDQNYPEYTSSIEILPDRQRIYGAHIKNGIPAIYTSLSTISPFSPTQSLDDENNLKLSIAPFFYNEIALYNDFYNNNNPNDDEQKGQILIALDYYSGYKEIPYKNGKIKTIYFKVPEDNGGIRALAIWDPGNIVSWGYGDGVFDYFKEKGNLPCKTGELGVRCQIGGNQWRAGAFAIKFNYKKNQKDKIEKAIIFTYAAYNNKDVMSDGVGGFKFYYTKYFKNIDEVVNYAISNYDTIINKTTGFTNKVRGGDGRKLPYHLEWIFSQAFHSYISNSWLVYSSKNAKDIRYYVEEGNCRYLSTVDVAHETAIFEAEYIPWVLAKQLVQWKKYILNDDFGAYLQHDMGQANRIYPYQQYNLMDGGKMAVEENLNYALLSYRHWKKTGATDFLKNNISTINKLLDSVIKRDNSGNGIVDVYKDRTTFDCCGEDYLLSISKENNYLGVKEFAAFIAANEMNLAANNSSKAKNYLDYAKKIKKTLDGLYNSYWTTHDGKQRHYFVVSQYTEKEGWGAASPAVFDGLIYLALTPPKNDGGLFQSFINYYVSPREGALLFSLVKANDRKGYRNVSVPDLNNPNYDPCDNNKCYKKGWISKLLNTTTILKYGKARDWNIFATDVWVKSKNLLQNASLGYQDSWYADTGAFDTLYLYPRGVSAIGPKLIK